MINHLNIHYFMTVAKERNITKAAEKLYISQQALSNHISSLEKELGVKLFERGSMLKMTYAGTVFYKYAVEMESSYRRMYQEIADIKEEIEGEIVIGISHTRGRFILPKILPAFIEKYPKVKVRVMEGNQNEIASAVLSGDVDLAIGISKKESKDIIYETLQEEEVVLVIADKLLERYGLDIEAVRHALEDRGRLSILKDIPFLMNKRGNTTRVVADELFKRENIVPHILIETENIETLGEMCKYAIGAAFYPQQLLEKKKNDYEEEFKLQLFKINTSYTKIPFAVGYRKNAYIGKILREMIEMIEQQLSS